MKSKGSSIKMDMYHNRSKNSSKLGKILTDLIKRNGGITFYEFMKIALYHPKYGYYSSSTLPFGKMGDFVTSPHASPAFGGAICCQLFEMWEVMGRGNFSLVEVGAGTGLLMRDVLNYCKDFFPDFFKKIDVSIVEPNKSLREIQKMNMEGFPCSWFDDCTALPPINGCVFSNELIDAFPVHLVKRIADEFFEVYVKNRQDGSFCDSLGPFSNKELFGYVSRYLNHVENGYTTEINLDLQNWIFLISEKLEQGFLFTIDYGFSRSEYFNPRRSSGTILSYRGHKTIEDVFSNPGQQDITHHVNFSDMVEWGMDVGLYPVGYCNQWSFLASIGIDTVIEKLFPNGFSPFSPQLAGIKMLLLPQGMGDTHKILIQAKGTRLNGVKLKGFNIQNKIKRLL